MPPHGVPEDNPVQCPHCSSIRALGGCAPAPLDWAAVQNGTIEEDPEISRGEARGVLERRFWRAFHVLCVAAVCGVGLFLWRQCGGPAVIAAADNAPSAENDRAAAAAGLRVLRAACAASAPEDLRPWVLEPDRIIPEMRNLSEREGGLASPAPRPSPGVAEDPEITGVPGYRVMRAQVNDTRGGLHKVRWEETPDGWRVDWESYVRLRVRQWNWLLGQAPGVTMELRLRVERSAVPESLYARDGVTPENHRAHAFFPAESERKALAFLRKDSPAARELEDLGWEDRLAVTATVRLISPETEPPVVEIRALTVGWR